jgi:hypothetical protein
VAQFQCRTVEVRPMPNEPSLLVTTLGIRDHFRDQVLTSLQRQRLAVGDVTAGYLVDLLTRFADPARLFSRGRDGLEIRALAEHYADAAHADGAKQRRLALKKLGDVALFIAGVFSGYLNRRVVDVDYYVAMGCGAYRELHGQVGAALGRDVGGVFDELARKFPRLVDVLADVGEASHLGASQDLLREYELWLRTGSARSRARLRRRGVEPVAQPVPRFIH